MKQIIFNKVGFFALLLMVLVGMTSCSQEDVFDAGIDNEQNLLLHVNVGDYHAFPTSETRAIGTPDAGKTKWESNDVVFVKVELFEGNVNNNPHHIEHLNYKYDGSAWVCTLGRVKIPFNKDQYGKTIPYRAVRVSGIYNPSFRRSSGTELTLIGTEGKNEAFKSKVYTKDEGKELNSIDCVIDFREQMNPRQYSRIRVAAVTRADVNIRAKGLRPAWYIANGISDKLGEMYLLKSSTDENGNAFFYVKWDQGTTFYVSSTPWGWYENRKTFTAPVASIDGMSYEIDMR